MGGGGHGLVERLFAFVLLLVEGERMALVSGAKIVFYSRIQGAF